MGQFRTAELVIASAAVAILLLMYVLGAWGERRDRKRDERGNDRSGTA